MAETINHAILLAAGRGTRVSDLGDKSLIRVGYPQEDVRGPRPEGVPLIELSFGNLVLAGMTHVLVIRNPDSRVEDIYGAAVDTQATLERQGRWRAGMERVLAPLLEVEYVVQPRDYQPGPHRLYGTGIWPSLARDSLDDWRQAGHQRFLVSECDSLPYRPDGGTPIRDLVVAAEQSPDSDMAAILVMPYPANTVNRYGMAQTVELGGTRYFIGIRESLDHPGAVALPGQRIEEYKNVTRFIFNQGLLDCAFELLEQPPGAANKGEYQITDAFNRYLAQGGQILTVVSGADDEFLDLGNYLDLQRADQHLRGLQQEPPVWDYRQAA